MGNEEMTAIGLTDGLSPAQGRTEDQRLAVNYFLNTQTKKGCLRKKSVPLVTEAQFDEMLSRRASEVTSSNVLTALGIVTPPTWVIDPLKVCNTELDGADYARIGADGKLRTSLISTTFLLYSRDVMFIYCRTSSLTDGFVRETAASIMYRDITSIELETVSATKAVNTRTADGSTTVSVSHTANTATISVPGKNYTVNVGSALPIMTGAVSALRAKIAEAKK